MTPEEREAWIDEYQGNPAKGITPSSTREMAARRGISWQAVQQRLGRAGIVRRRRGGDNRKPVRTPVRTPLRGAGER